MFFVINPYTCIVSDLLGKYHDELFITATDGMYKYTEYVDKHSYINIYINF